MRKLFISFALVAGVIFIITQIQDFGSIINTVKRSDLRFLLLAILVESIWLLNVATLYRAIYRGLSIRESIREMLLAAAAANFFPCRPFWTICGPSTISTRPSTSGGLRPQFFNGTPTG